MTSIGKFESMMRVDDRASQGEVTTPTALVNEMIDSLPKDVLESDSSTFCDPCFGNGTFIVELIKRLRKYGHTIENIQSRIYGCEISKRLYNKVWKKLSNYSFNNLHHGDALEYDFNNMKFDVVIGNPPYNQQGDSNNQLYQHFWNLAFKLGNITSLILPYNMISGLKKGNIDKVKVSHYIPQYICTGISQQYFKNIGVDILYFVCNKNINNNLCLVESKATGNTTEVDILTVPIDVYDSRDKVAYAKKHFKQFNDIPILTGDAGSEEVEGNDVVVYDNARKEPRNISLPDKKFKINPYKPKVLFNIFSSGDEDEFVLDIKGNVLPSSKHNLFYVICDTTDRAKELYNDLNSQRFKEYKTLFNSRNVIYSYIQNVFTFKTSIK